MKTQKFPFLTLIWVTAFAIAMGFLESAVVIYMRALLYPHGFQFPLTVIPPALAMTEIFREAATLIMLLGIGVLAGKNSISRFAWFLFTFAVWDIFYYVFLKLILHWPESFFTWDILFLIPVVWVGPIIAPVILSVCMIVLALILVHANGSPGQARPVFKEWSLWIAGSVVVIVSFAWDYTAFVLQHYPISEIWSVPGKDLMALSLKYIPLHFNWILYLCGLALIIAGIVMFFVRNIKSYRELRE